MRGRFVAAIAVALGSAIAVSGCSVSPVRVIQDSSASVAVDAPFSSYNPHTSSGSGTTNADVSYATGAGFTYYNDAGEIERDESFGRYQKLADDPLTVKYTIADGARWSDGAAIDAADLLLAWVASSGAENTPNFDPSEYVDPSTGSLRAELPPEVVYFDSANSHSMPYGINLATQLPAVSDDRKSITLIYDSPFADWETAFFGLESSGLPAHVVAANAFSLGSDTQRAKDSIIAAIVGRDVKALGRISAFWNSGFNLTSGASGGLGVSSGPYAVSDVGEDGSVTLKATSTYSGSRQPIFEQVRLRYIPDPLAAIQALSSGEVQLVSPRRPTPQIVASLAQVDVQVVAGFGSAFDHIDLQFDESKSDHFGNPLVREAFLKTIPRADIASAILPPTQENSIVRNSFVFEPGTEHYAAAAAQNGSAAYAAPDIEGARALLAQARMSEPEVCILYDPANSDRVKAFSLIQASASVAGFNVSDCSSADWRAELGAAGAYDAALFGWQPTSLGADASTLAYGEDSPANLNGYASGVTEALLAKLDNAGDAAAQTAVLIDIDRAIFADFYGLPLYQSPSIFAYDSQKITGVSASTLAPGVLWNVWEWKPGNDR